LFISVGTASTWIYGTIPALQPAEFVPYPALDMRKTSIYLSDEQADHLARLAQAEGRSQAAIVREAISSYRPRPNQDPNFALAGNFERIDPGTHPISEIAEGKLLRGFGE
jgi:predicted DNA-binding protein